jgi:hypothetical protein
LQQKWGKRSSTWSDTPFWPISLKENQQKGCQKGGKSTFTKYTFQNPRMILYHKASPPVLFWDEKRPWLGRGGL